MSSVSLDFAIMMHPFAMYFKIRIYVFNDNAKSLYQHQHGKNSVSVHHIIMHINALKNNSS